jgi:uncharacterized protein
MKKRYLVYLDNKYGHESKNSRDILLKLRMLTEPHSYNEEIRDIRISRFFIELDVGAHQETIFMHPVEKFISSLGKIGSILFIDEISDEKKYASIEETISSAIYLFNMERFWKSHEVLESVWKDASGSNKKLLNGIILVDAAYVHLQKYEPETYFSILRRSVEKLKDTPEYLYNINMKLLLQNVEYILSEKKVFYFKILLK